MPALAIADALKARGARVSFIGTPRGLETELVPGQGYELDLADLRGLERRLSPRTLLFFWSLVKGAIDCARILRRRRPDAIVGGGGYVSWAPVFLGALTRRPTLIIELDSHMGLANRALSPFARRVALCFDIPGRTGGKYFHAGRPLSPALLAATPEAGRKQFGLTPDLPVVLVTGGSLGARSINDACVEAFGRGLLDFQLVHVSGRRDHESVKNRLRAAGGGSKNYHLLDYTDKLPLAMAAADLVVGRSGASVLEVSALGKPAILVPYPHATADHQLQNAQWMAAAGAARIIIDAELSARTLSAAVTGLLADREQLAAMAAASAGLTERGGADRIASVIFEMTDH
ncbi:MAG: UDP-N-acetylglucosamine--N-acetylmuramyl-(pentapeptide) pyrophosphoryl-undecaprenol N-acetylglucosamine transferase [Thermoleophilia bacterium]